MKLSFIRLTKQKGLAQIPIILGLLLMAIAIPIATKLSQESTENRSKAQVYPDICVVSKFDCSANALWKCVRTDGVADWQMVQNCDLNGSTCSVDVDRFAGRCESGSLLPTAAPRKKPPGFSMIMDFLVKKAYAADVGFAHICGSKQINASGSCNWNSDGQSWFSWSCADFDTNCGGVIPTPVAGGTCKFDDLQYTIGSGRCVDLILGIDGYKTCKEDLKWSSTISCGIGKVCEGGECISNISCTKLFGRPDGCECSASQHCENDSHCDIVQGICIPGDCYDAGHGCVLDAETGATVSQYCSKCCHGYEKNTAAYPPYVCTGSSVTPTPTKIPTPSLSCSSLTISLDCQQRNDCEWRDYRCQTKSTTPTKIPSLTPSPSCSSLTISLDCQQRNDCEWRDYRCQDKIIPTPTPSCSSLTISLDCQQRNDCEWRDYRCQDKITVVPTIPYVPNPTAITTPVPTLQPGQACRTDADCGGSTKSGCAVQCVTDYCPGNSGCGKTEGTAGALNCQLYPPAGTVWNDGYSACVGVLPTPVNPPPPPGPTNPPTPPVDCGYDSLQAMVQPNIDVDWNTQLAIGDGEKVNLGCMHDGSGELAENVILVAEHSSDSNEFNQSLVSQWEPPEVGNYTVWCKSTDSQCDGLVSNTNATLSVGSVCKECPNDFHCYGPADDKVEFGYAWFATGYVMQGWVTQVPDSYCKDAGLLMPQWIGKGVGDANCDGKLDIADSAVWRNEFADISQGDKVYREDWEADFTGTDGVCDGYVDLGDYSLWRARFNLYSGGGN